MVDVMETWHIYLASEISGLQVISDQEETTGGSQDCTVIGGKGRHIDSGKESINIAGINFGVEYTVHECEIELITKVAGVPTQRYIINRRNNRIEVKWTTSPVTRYVFRAWVQNKELWVELEAQHRILTGQWRRTGGGRTKLGSWSSLKI
jgi:hypothetical protein